LASPAGCSSRPGRSSTENTSAPLPFTSTGAISAREQAPCSAAAQAH
jgi:hypothetical protein